MLLVLIYTQHIVFFPPAIAENLTLKDSRMVQEEEQKEVFIAFARVYSRTVKKGQRVFVLGPKYDPTRGLSLVSPQLSFIHKHMIPLLSCTIQMAVCWLFIVHTRKKMCSFWTRVFSFLLAGCYEECKRKRCHLEYHLSWLSPSQWLYFIMEYKFNKMALEMLGPDCIMHLLQIFQLLMWSLAP